MYKCHSMNLPSSLPIRLRVIGILLQNRAWNLKLQLKWGDVAHTCTCGLKKRIFCPMSQCSASFCVSFLRSKLLTSKKIQNVDQRPLLQPSSRMSFASADCRQTENWEWETISRAVSWKENATGFGIATIVHCYCKRIISNPPACTSRKGVRNCSFLATYHPNNSSFIFSPHTSP